MTGGARQTRGLIAVGVLLVMAGGALAQFGGGRGRLFVQPNVPYDGRFTFVRVTYQTAPGGYWYGGWPAWAHGYPLAEQNLMRIINDLSNLDPHIDEINTLTFDDPELFKFPVAYIIEVGWWTLTDREAVALRAYLRKGGFVIVDDFKLTGDRGGGGWETFAVNMQRVLPGARFVDMDVSDPMIVNYNTDISQFWEWSGRGFRSIDETNEAYKLGVNYIMSHALNAECAGTLHSLKKPSAPAGAAIKSIRTGSKSMAVPSLLGHATCLARHALPPPVAFHEHIGEAVGAADVPPDVLPAALDGVLACHDRHVAVHMHSETVEPVRRQLEHATCDVGDLLGLVRHGAVGVREEVLVRVESRQRRGVSADGGVAPVVLERNQLSFDAVWRLGAGMRDQSG